MEQLIGKHFHYIYGNNNSDIHEITNVDQKFGYIRLFFDGSDDIYATENEINIID